MRLGVKPASNQWVKPTGTTLRFVPAAYLGVKSYEWILLCVPQVRVDNAVSHD